MGNIVAILIDPIMTARITTRWIVDVKDKPDKMEEKLDILKKNLEKYKNAVLAFSGGVDSTFLAKVAGEVYGENLLLITATSSSYPFYELEEAASLAKLMGLKHRVIVSEEMQIPGYVGNPPDRCYYCKSELFQKISYIAEKEGYEAVLDGSNAEDMKEFRPGLKAKREFGVLSPLAEAGFTKSDIRFFSSKFGLPTASRPSYACLASRIPYGETITEGKLDRIGKAEFHVRKLGFTQFRIRSHENLARMEFLPGEMEKAWLLKEKLNEICISAGFNFSTIDLKGYRSGSMNETLTKTEKERILKPQSK